MPRPKLALSQKNTPLLHLPALDALVGTEVWIKRDDMTGGAEAGNKIRKLEYLLAQACEQGAQTVITCGGAQSNHARATAIVARRLGLSPLLFLRREGQDTPLPPYAGNLLLDALLGAEVRFIDRAQYAQRNELMAQALAEHASRGERAYVIPEGGSNGLGALGYVDAMGEIAAQRAEAGAPRRFGAVVCACGSGGTAAGVSLGIAQHDLADEVIAMAVCDDRSYFEEVIAGITREARALLDADLTPVPLRVEDRWKGPAYGVPSAEQARFIATVARHTGLILDPVYTGKALYGLAQLEPKPKTALFLHTGGLPGLLAAGEHFMNL